MARPRGAVSASPAKGRHQQDSLLHGPDHGTPRRSSTVSATKKRTSGRCGHFPRSGSITATSSPIPFVWRSPNLPEGPQDRRGGQYEEKGDLNDSDLRVPIRIVEKELGIRVGVINPHPPKYRSRVLKATFFKQLRPSVLADCQLPDVLVDEQGEFHKPASW